MSKNGARLRATLASLILAWAMAGCAIVRTGEDGETSIIGFVNITIPSPNANAARAGTGVRTRVLGLSVLRSELGSGVSFGYSDHAFLAVGNNTCLRLQPGEVLP